MDLSEWLYPLRAFKEMHGEEGGEEGPSNAIVERWSENLGATLMGRHMFEPGGSGPWGNDPYRSHDQLASGVLTDDAQRSHLHPRARPS